MEVGLGLINPHMLKHMEVKSSFAKDEVEQDFENKWKDYASSDTRGWQATAHGRPDYNKENQISGANGTSCNHTPQRARSKKVRQPLESYEENSQDSGYPSPIQKEKRDFFTQHPTSAASRNRMNHHRALNSYAISPTYRLKPASSTLLRSLSSGYESMDDGLVSELNDMEATDEEEMQLPSGISKLLSGDIVAPEASSDYVSTTPEFPRRAHGKSEVDKWMTAQRNVKVSSPLTRSPFQTRSPSLAKSPLGKMPPLSKIRTCLFRSPTDSCSKRTMMRTYSYDEATAPYYRLQMEISPNSIRSFKRPLENVPKTDESSILKRSRRSCGLHPDSTTPIRRSGALTHSQVTLQRSLSETRPAETHTNIKWAIHRSITDNDLIGDFSKPCILPLTNGMHADLKSITSDTLAALLRGEFSDRVASYTIVDCRYPYEFDGGHINGAVNIYSTDQVQQMMFNHLTDTVPNIQHDTDKRNILVFHCEFSWKRGPTLTRILRRLDRSYNKKHYPALYYPEIYLLMGGYEKFYSEQKEFCMPQNYKPMKHPNHEEECRFFRSKTKSWQAEKTKGISQTVRTNLERFAF
ncbi:M-phase inducer phosphatase isoform X2 [Cardiocondyla obscurior]|uniref:M-phase inducer phosphatase isoform X2 n=1 Tax=Cardiocondyla obscurior TaxID=286306 RepID=UPI0039657123